MNEAFANNRQSVELWHTNTPDVVVNSYLRDKGIGLSKFETNEGYLDQEISAKTIQIEHKSKGILEKVKTITTTALAAGALHTLKPEWFEGALGYLNSAWDKISVPLLGNADASGILPEFAQLVSSGAKDFAGAAGDLVEFIKPFVPGAGIAVASIMLARFILKRQKNEREKLGSDYSLAA